MTHWAFDSEVYRNYYLAMFQNIETGEVVWWDSVEGVRRVPSGTLVTFNGLNYDMPLLEMALAGASPIDIKQVSDDIILRDEKRWPSDGGPDHIDLMNVAPGTAGLKIYGGRMHSQRLRDLPIEPDAFVGEDERQALIEYCQNDLQTTIDLFHTLRPQLELREQLSGEFGIDLRSKSDAQIAEAVIRRGVEFRKGTRVFRPQLHPSYTFKYRPPAWVSFASDGLLLMLRIIRDAQFGLDAKGAVEMPPALNGMRLTIGAGEYRLGIGGLHSSEVSVARVEPLIDRDVTSYYPSIILNEGFYPEHLGEDFLIVYRDLVERRLAAKARGDKVMSDALKICVNGSFGKLGSPWSVLYSPNLLIQVTLTGQLALLMLIEALEKCGFPVRSANTDGVMVHVTAERKPQFDAVVGAWEITTGFTTEESEYSAVFSRDVNNYVALKKGGGAKTTGVFASGGLKKNPTADICIDAVIAKLTHGIPVELTVYDCRDTRRFMTVRKVDGGAMYGDEYLGRAVRWYYSKTATGAIQYARNGNKVPRTDGARPLMELPDRLPFDLDHRWYIDEAKKMLTGMGVTSDR